MDQCCYILEIEKEGVPSSFLNQRGAIEIPAGKGQSLKRVVNKSDLTDIYKLKIDGIVSLSVPYSPAAHLAFKDYFDPNVVSEKKKPLYANIRKGAGTLPQHYLNPIGKDDKSKKYTVQVSYGKDHWIYSLDDCPLCDLYDIEKEVTKDFITEEWGNELYTTGDIGVMFPPVYYGRLEQSPVPHFGISNFRPWLNACNFLERAFCKGGWKVKGDILNTEWFKRKWMYAASNPRNSRNPFLASLTNPHNGLLGENYFDLNVISDPDETLSVDHFQSVGLYCFDFTGSVNFISDNSSAPSSTNIQIIKKSGGEETVVDNVGINIGCEQDQSNNQVSCNGKIAKTSNQIFLNAGESICFRITLSGNITDLEVNINVNNIVKDSFIVEGQILNLKDYITCNKTTLEILKGLIHEACLVPETDLLNKCVTFYPAVTVNVCGEIIEGYDKTGDPIDITDLVICDTRKSTIPSNIDAARYCVYGYAESTDPYVTETNGYDGEDMPFDLLVDIGIGKNETKYKRNPVFEPTLLRTVTTTGYVYNNGLLATQSPQYIADVPNLTDNLDGDYSTDIGCRIMTFENANGNNGGISYCGEKREDFPIAWHDQAQTNNNEASECKSSYTDAHVELLYKKKSIANLCNPTDILQFRMTDAKFGFFTNRDEYTFRYEGKGYTGHISNLIFDCCKGIATATINYPTSAYLCLLPDEGIECNNNVQILCVENGDCYDFSYSGTQDSSIVSTLWEYQYQTNGSWGSTWMSLGNNPTAQLCNPTDIFRVRIKLSFDDGCSSVTDVSIKNPCSEWNPQLKKSAIQNADGEWCITWVLSGDIPSNPSDYTIVKSEITISGVTTPYTLGDKINNPQNDVSIVVQVDFDDNCPVYPDLIDTCVIPPPMPTCDDTNAIPECIDNNGGIIFTYTGIFAMPPKWIKYWYTCDEIDGIALWTPGDDPIECSNICVYLEAGFCDVCPTYCSDEVKCETEECLQTVSLAVKCVSCDIEAIISNPDNEDINGLTYCWLSSLTQNGTYNTVDSGTIAGGVIPSILDAPSGWYKLQIKQPNCPTIESNPFEFIKPDAGEDTTIDL